MKLDIIEHYEEEDGGGSIYLMDTKGITVCRMYWFNDYPSPVLERLHISKEHRNKGLGTYLQEYRENKAREMGYKTVSLWVLKDTWMIEWYERRGYSYFGKYEKENAIWMRKKL